MRTPGVADKMLASASDFTRPGVEYVLRNAFDGIWARDGLEKKYRSLVVISWVHTSLPTQYVASEWPRHQRRRQRGLTSVRRILASTGKTAQLKSHVGMGLGNGLTEVEIREAVLHVMGYCGFPTGLDA
jgi:4-carboxymuconolactone decarboxylase